MKKIARLLTWSMFLALGIHEVWAQQGTGLTTTTTAVTKYYELMVLHGNGADKSFRMEYGACLRGPLQFFDMDGKVLFELDKDVEFPSGCGAGVAHLRN